MKEAKQARKQGKAQPMNDAGREGKPISLAPLNFEEALGGFLQTDVEAVRELERKAKEARESKKRVAKKTARK
jgi:hypothetical protein